MIPMRSTVDTTHGKVKLTSAVNSHKNQSGDFSQGAFVVTQRKSDGLTDLTLTGGDLAKCPKPQATKIGVPSPFATAAAKHGRLFGSAHGRFRTRGRNSSATVRGTQWLTDDGCTGTVTNNVSPNDDEQDRHGGAAGPPVRPRPGPDDHLLLQQAEPRPDMYCLILLAEPPIGARSPAESSRRSTSTATSSAWCAGDKGGCTDPLPLTAEDEHGFRQAIFACPVRLTGPFEFGWSIDGLQSVPLPHAHPDAQP